ncbi:MAG TPA: bifunctional class I SAM-dependent methyltransferase/glycosyltransferase family 2 protein [Anaerolineaceae bacterium]|nr:glycosyltransferase [Anaerolineaceae bacterium]HOE35309.1 bifunctional class I SAM-dependent methyltransferase/glycosyltransferase family 2 protein [Anaerolineaceae bacterium]HOT25667.1 bifunctional class I SAM-dependent methyltransferase/glycosyltransferase family 2 protein [Anaerolineaceae bacterium]HQH57847.1 bifunctional class I SAM-dependent methyltransferase/glycosyltransferase family 2 protein [Anaerolineaceae bacterium]HQK03277.1 bifunctional class I SAM-dependent methyltransferase/g
MKTYLNSTDKAYLDFTQKRTAHWDALAEKPPKKINWSAYYHRRLRHVYQHIIPPGCAVLEVGCGKGDLLAAVKPALGVGIDFSEAMVRAARGAHPEMRFLQADAHALPDLGETFDYIILSDLVNDLWDVQHVLNQLQQVCSPRTRVVLNFYNRGWELPLKIAQFIGTAKSLLDQNWLTQTDMKNLLNLGNFEVVRKWTEVLFPFNIPLFSPLVNRVIARLWPFKHLCMTNMMIARPRSAGAEKPASVSVVVAARNEAGNIPQIFERVPEMGSGTEIVFVEGHSQDNTWQVIEETMQQTSRNVKLLKQPGKGKGDAVRAGFQAASGDVLMILDADLTVPPEDLPRFYDALVNNQGEFINGVRLVYPMEEEAMRFLNSLGNKFFSVAFSWLLGQSIKDTLCGTKVLWRIDYEKIAKNRAFFGDFDPFGDFDLIFGAAKQNLKLVDMPIRYRERTYGSTNIQRWRHGLLLLRMLWVAAVRLKFV